MPLSLSFTFRNKLNQCEPVIDNSALPCFIFVQIANEELIAEFGEDITIKTDGESRLSKKDDYPELVALRQTLFDAIKTTPEFLLAKAELRVLEESRSNSTKNYS